MRYPHPIAVLMRQVHHQRLLVLAMAHGQLQYPVSVAELLHTPDWAKPIVMRAMELNAARD